MAAHLPLFVKGSIFSLPSSTSMSSSCTYSSISHTVASPGFHSSPAAANKSVKLGTMQRMDGVRSVKHRMTSLHGKMKKRQQIKASAQAPNGTYTHPDYVPEANFYKVEAMLRPWRVSHVTSGLLKMGIRGVTVSDVRGFGVQAGSAERQAVHRMNGVRWVNHRIVILDGKMKKQQQIKASTQAPNATNTCPDYIPKANFYRVEAILRPWRMSHVTSGLLKLGVRGVTVSDVKGFGAQGASAERQAGSEFSKDNFVSKVKMEIVVSKDQVEAVIDTIIDEARTGEIGDGKIFVVPVADVIRVRTGERGLEAERMAGGRSEILTGVRQEVTDSN